MTQGRIESQNRYKNNREVRFARSKTSPIVIYTPDDLIQYARKNEVYDSKAVTDANGQKNYFLYRETEGPITLYSLKLRRGSRYFLFKDEVLTELTKKSFRSLLSNDFSESIQRQLPLVSFHAPSMSRFVHLGNQGYSGSLPFVRKGIVFGLANTSPSVADNKSHLSSPGLAPYYGLSFEFPLGFNPRLYFSFQPGYGKYDQVFHVHEGDINSDYIVKSSYVILPMLIKRMSTGLKVRHFVTGGVTIRYYNQLENTLIQATTVGHVINISRNENAKVSQLQIGANVGAGLEYSLTLRNIVSIELRLIKSYGVQGGVVRAPGAVQIISSLSF